jgi:hypothetical protein
LCEESNKRRTETAEMRFLVGGNPLTFPEKEMREDIRRNNSLVKWEIDSQIRE